MRESPRRGIPIRYAASRASSCPSPGEAVGSGELVAARPEARGVGVEPTVGAAVEGLRQVLAGEALLGARPGRLGGLAELGAEDGRLFLDGFL
ncbi:hypothetical protein GCM10027080_17380 [Pedococcus soli]